MINGVSSPTSLLQQIQGKSGAPAAPDNAQIQAQQQLQQPMTTRPVQESQSSQGNQASQSNMGRAASGTNNPANLGNNIDVMA